MRLVSGLLVIAVLVSLACAQIGYKLNGHYTRSQCLCTDPAAGGDCDDIWDTDYPGVMSSSLGATTWQGLATDGRNLIFTLGQEAGEIQVTTPIAAYYCHGPAGQLLVCENAARNTQYCTVTFSCISGDCVTAIGAKSMRSIMYPIIGTVFAVSWLAIAFLKGLPVDLIVTIVSIAIFVMAFFLIIGYPFFYGLVAMAFAALALHAHRGKHPWSVTLAIVSGIFVFLWFAGLNSLTNQAVNLPYFDWVQVGFLYEECYTWFGTNLYDQRCAQYGLFTGFLGFVITVVTPGLVLLLLTKFTVPDK